MYEDPVKTIKKKTTEKKNKTNKNPADNVLWVLDGRWIIPNSLPFISSPTRAKLDDSLTHCRLLSENILDSKSRAR